MSVEHAQTLTAPVNARALALLNDREASELRERLLTVAAALGLPNTASRPPVDTPQQ